MRIAFTILSISAIFLTGAFAQQMKGPGRGHGYGHGYGICKSDREKFCANEKGHLKIHACMDAHLNELSPDCKKFHGNMSSEMKGNAHANCVKDIEKFCNDVEPGQGRMRDCLKSHKAEISAECKKSHPNL